MCEKMPVKELCVTKCVKMIVCERIVYERVVCVKELCMKLLCVQVCAFQFVCERVVCDNVVCEREVCVTKLWQNCAKKERRRRRRRLRRRRTGYNTKMWGKNHHRICPLSQCQGCQPPIAMLQVLDLLAALGGLLPSSKGSTCPAADERWCADMGSSIETIYLLKRIRDT